MFYVYVIRNPEGILYKGSTKDLEKRMHEHNQTDGPVSYTRNRGPWMLVYKEEFLTRGEARIRENFLKMGKGREFLKALLDK